MLAISEHVRQVTQRLARSLFVVVGGPTSVSLFACCRCGWRAFCDAFSAAEAAMVAQTRAAAVTIALDFIMFDAPCCVGRIALAKLEGSIAAIIGHWADSAGKLSTGPAAGGPWSEEDCTLSAFAVSPGVESFAIAGLDRAW